jgi:acyl-CoA reductase-like NAD-dependent aldehyde dehydrogenase
MASFNLPDALLGGCTVVLKPSELTPLSAAYLVDAALIVGSPPGVFNAIPATAAGSDALVRHPGVNKVAFTGSTLTGRKIAETAAPTLKHVSLELGGKAAASTQPWSPKGRRTKRRSPHARGYPLGCRRPALPPVRPAG